MTSSLEHHLLNYDGKAVSLLSQARAACGKQPTYFQELAALCIDTRPKISEGATWILKAELENGTDVPQSSIDQIVASFENIQSWQAVLHICQSVELFKLTPKQAERFVAWAKPYNSHSRPFLRAWSLHALVTLGLQFPQCADLIPAALIALEVDAAASVRARGRQLRKILNAAERRHK